MSDYETEYESLPEDHAVFVDCTCDHERDQHGWGDCNVDDCPCEGGWEE